jgi:hypothetical protein
MNELSSRHQLLNQQRRAYAGLAGKDSGTTHVTMTSDAMTRLDLTPNFDVTYLPRIYDDPTGYQYEKLEPSDVVTPEMARAQLAPLLARATLD